MSERVQTPLTPAPPREPSWPVVIATTLRLWLDRHKISGRSRWTVVTLGVVVIGAVAAVTVVRVASTHAARATVRLDAGQLAPSQGSPAQVVAGALTRAVAAAWIARQVDPLTIVACDPAMCAALRDAGLVSGQLTVPRLSGTDPEGPEVIVATAAVRGQLGTRLASSYAPEVIASFGSGAARIDIRAVTPGAAATFAATLTSDLDARVAAGQQLLRGKHVHATAAVRATLTAGTVDPRLLSVLAVLAKQQARQQSQLNILAFTDPSPGAADVPLRGAEIGGPTARLRAMLAFLRRERSPFLPAQARLVRVRRGVFMLSIQYDAPGPLGLDDNG